MTVEVDIMDNLLAKWYAQGMHGQGQYTQTYCRSYYNDDA